ncbi:hypothetical protein IAQ61_007861 [Plenodomus lingam]|uniref:Uncharacterized protein n=1 Tax=Leptosphaeria maculans (strain JN3 / isolate v23.1.3 / race Av1-4-5-6-7-8) TaxID=985895 RepID=E5A4G6_LEPMJ|nr:hypothetical protein LEMA_P077500.1 [Plenodomus lingam JN3]KAH9867269.1 hypothetical protein IAQ61_007861 [Plenodomus lingam]CBX98511.1 hypothetical protein LEMA_P077500.1 [Plenodomus lingam JN3]
MPAMLILCWALLFTLTWSAGEYSPSSNHSDEHDLFKEAFDHTSADQDHIYARDYVRFDRTNIASQAMWDMAVANAERLSCMMRRTDIDAGKILRDSRSTPSAESSFSGPFQARRIVTLLKSWGWHKTPTPEYMTRFFTHWGWDEAERDWKGLFQLRDNTPIRLKHADPNDRGPLDTQHYIGPDNNFYWSTGAQVSFVFNRPAGMIFIAGFQNVRTEFVAVHHYQPKIADLPKLRFLSDLLWVHWHSYSSSYISELKYFAIARITSLQSQQMIAYALAKRGIITPLPGWPGVTFTADEEAGKALIGSLGMSCAQLLFAHKWILGLKHISKVTVFRDTENEWYPQAVFYIEPVPDNLLIPQEDGNWQPYPTGVSAAIVDLDTRAVAEPGPYQRDADGNFFRLHDLTLGS